MNKYFVAAISMFMFATSCKHDENAVIGGKGGNAGVIVYPHHHHVATHLINFTVYVKYNTSDAPANGVYDDSLTCTNHDSLVSATFTGLKNGNYYFFGKGYDTSIAQDVKGGAPYTVAVQQTQSMELAVTED